jgi:cell wall assembly regulator SMI1
MVTFQEACAALTSDDLDDVERIIGIKLPFDLRAHYLTHNGGRPIPGFYFFEGEFYGVHEFLAMKANEKCSYRHSEFERAYFNLSIGNLLLPNECIPFAIDEGGDVYVYNLSDKKYGTISIVQHEFYEDKDRYVINIAPSLKAFLDGLCDAPPL